VFKLADFPFGDVDNRDHVTKVEIETLPLKGKLTLNGVAVHAEQRISADDIEDGRLVYVPPAGASGTDVADFKFEVTDAFGADFGR